MLGIVGSYDCMQLQEKLIIYTQENSKKPHFGPDFGPFGPCTISGKTNDPILRKISDGRTDGQTNGITGRPTRVI